MASIQSLIGTAVKTAVVGAFRAQTFTLSAPRSSRERFAAAKAREMNLMVNAVADINEEGNALISAVSSSLEAFTTSCVKKTAERARLLREAYWAARRAVLAAAKPLIADMVGHVRTALNAVASAYAKVNLAGAGISLQGLRGTPLRGVFRAAKGRLKASLMSLHAAVSLAA